MRNGMLEVISIETIGRKGGKTFQCQCDCGEKRTLKEYEFYKQKSCGCTKHPKYEGRKFGRLTVISKAAVRNGRCYWVCSCSCGQTAEVSSAHLNNGTVKSCGCLRNELVAERSALEPGEALKNRVIESYFNNAKNKGHACNLSKDDFNLLLASKCHYCGESPSRIKRHNALRGEFAYNGIDRKDNSIGYTTNNVVTCCTQCNFRKSSTNYNEFVSWVAKVAKNMNLL